MAWTSPRTWVAGETVTAALLNTHLRDNLLDLGGASSTWTAFTPVWKVGATTLTLSVSQGRYKQIGKTVIAAVSMTTTTAAASGQWYVSTPVAAAAFASGNTPIGVVSYTVNNANWQGGRLWRDATNGSSILSWDANGSQVSTTSSGDQLDCTFHYEAA